MFKFWTLGPFQLGRPHYWHCKVTYH